MSAVAVLGMVRAALPRANPFLVEGLHTNLALVTIGFGGVHVVASILDPYAGLGPLDALVPFLSAYRSAWLGLGVVGAYLYVGTILISWPVRRLSRATWKWVHRLMYGAWLLALVHSLGTGSDARNDLFLFLNVVTVAAVLVTFVAVRAAEGWRSSPALWAALGTLSIVALAGVSVWAVDGPLQPGWARAAGTPPNLLHPSP